MKLLTKKEIARKDESKKTKDMLDAYKLSCFVEKKRRELNDIMDLIEAKKRELQNL